jgi:hypothetical protein
MTSAPAVGGRELGPVGAEDPTVVGGVYATCLLGEEHAPMRKRKAKAASDRPVMGPTS